MKDWMRMILRALVAGLALAAVTLMVVAVVKSSMDRDGVPHENGVGVVVEHHYHGSYVTSVKCGNVHAPVYHSATYDLRITVGQRSDTHPVSESFYANTHDGQQLHVTYQVGHSGRLYIETLNY